MTNDSNNRVQVLVAAMNQQDDLLPEKMHLNTSAVIGNQCSRVSDEIVNSNGHEILYLNRKDRGVGMNRNEALLHATGDYLTIADEDMVLADNYEELVQKAFEEIPDADGIIFNIITLGKKTGRRENNKISRVHVYDFMNYGAARLSVKRSSVKRENILFHTCFGGGTRYYAGEDVLFIADMLKHHLKIYTYPAVIGSVDQTTSTWFEGYNKKLLHDKGSLYAAMSKFWAKPLCIQALIRHKNLYCSQNLSFPDAYKIMVQGIKDFRNLDPYK